jgi:histidinol-phosphate aminotransferase
VSELDQRVPEALRALSGYHVPQPAGVRVKLDANELPFAVPAELRQRLGAELAAVALERYPDPRAAELRAVVAQRDNVTESQIVFGNGSDELIAMLVNAFATGPVLYPTPSFVYYRLAAIARGVTPIEIPTSSRFELDELAMLRAVEVHRPGVVFLALPNNPTGTLWRMGFALELAARHRDVVVVSDEAYLAYCGRSNLPELAAHPNLVVMRTLSKIGMAGLRVGYSISSTAIAEVLEKVRPPYNLSALDQRAARFMLTEGAAWCAARAREVVAERDHLARQLATVAGIEVLPSEANLLLLRVADPAELWKKLLDFGILVRRFSPDGPLSKCLRVTIGTPSENAQLLDAIRSG